MESELKKLFAIYHIATDAKRALLDNFLGTRKLSLNKFLNDRDKNIHHFEDVRRARRQSTSITTKDLGAGTLNHVFQYCDDMFWETCSFYSPKMSFEEFLNKHKDVLSTHASTKNFPSGYIGNDALGPCDYNFLFNNETGLANKDIQLKQLNRELSFTVLNMLQNRCPSMLKSINLLTEKQSRICYICVYRERETNAAEIEELLETVKCHILTVADHCQQMPQFEDQIRSIQLDRLPNLDNQRIIVDDALNDDVSGKDEQFMAKARESLSCIIFEANEGAVKLLCREKIMLPRRSDEGYKPGQYAQMVINSTEDSIQTKKENLKFRMCLCQTQGDLHTNESTVGMTKDESDSATHELNYLRLFKLLKDIARDAFIDVLRQRFPPNVNFGDAFNNIKENILPILTQEECDILYPTGSTYSGDLYDLDLTLLYIVLRNLNTIQPHKNEWGSIPEDDDHCLSANIDRLRIAKNTYVSHYPKGSIQTNEFNNLWDKYRQCILEIVGAEYKESYVRAIDELRIRSFDPKGKNQVKDDIVKMEESDATRQKENANLQRDIKKVLECLMLLLECYGISPSDRENHVIKDNEKLGKNPNHVKIKFEGEGLCPVQDIAKSKDALSNEECKVKSVEEGSVIFYLEFSSSAFRSVKYFFGVVETFLADVFKLFKTQEQRVDQQMWISIEFLEMEDVVPKVSVKNLYQDVVFGTSVYLQCTVTAKPGCTEVWWTKIALGIPKSINVDHIKYSGSNVISPSLMINRVDLGDKGVYVCNARNCFGVGKSETINLTVSGKAPIIRPIHNKYFVQLGKEIQLKCSIYSDPIVTSTEWSKTANSFSDLVWTSNGGAINPSKYDGHFDSLTLKNGEFKDRATYICSAENCFGKSHSIPIQLYVEPDDKLKRDIATWKQIRDETIPALKQLVEDMKKANTKIRATRITRNVVVFAAICALPFTGGLSAAGMVGGTACAAYLIEFYIEKTVLEISQKRIDEDKQATIVLLEKCSFYIREGSNSPFLQSFVDIKLGEIDRLSTNRLEQFIKSFMEANNMCLLKAIESISNSVDVLENELRKVKEVERQYSTYRN